MAVRRFSKIDIRTTCSKTFFTLKKRFGTLCNAAAEGIFTPFFFEGAAFFNVDMHVRKIFVAAGTLQNIACGFVRQTHE